MDYVIIKKNTLRSLYDDSLKLDALLNSGVDTWKNYSNAMQEFKETEMDYPFEEEIEKITESDLKERLENKADNFYKVL
jgi:hypothetical protein